MTTFFMPTWWGDSKNMEEIEFSRWLFEGRLRQGKNVLPDGLNWLWYFAGNSKSHRENSISFIFLESPHQLGMKNVVKCYKDFFGYFNALKTHCETADFCCSLTVCHLVSQNHPFFFTFFCFIQLKVCFGFENWQLLEPCVAID